MGEFPCVDELTATTFDLSAYLVKPGRYQVRFTVGDRSQTRDFRILIDPRLEGNSADPMADYEEIDRLSRSIYQAAVEMGQGISELRRVKDQLDVVLRLSEAGDVQDGGTALAGKMDAWIERLLQKELRTFQNHYQFEARQLVKMKDLLNEMGGNELPLGQGYRDVSRDYLVIWTELASQLQAIKNQDIPGFNEVLRRAGLPELYVSRPIS